MGVSATHIDWTLVPYVRKSFRKHMRNYYELVEGLTKEDAEGRVKDIEKKYGDIKMDNDKLKSHIPLVFNYALRCTEKETLQGAEGLYHNLNTLQLTHNNQVTNGCLAA